MRISLKGSIWSTLAKINGQISPRSLSILYQAIIDMNGRWLYKTRKEEGKLLRIALDTNGNRVDAKVADKGQIYTCPVCGEKVVPKATISKLICPHFAHKQRAFVMSGN